MKIIFIDTETTGLNATTNDVVQIAGYITENQKVLDSFNLRCQPLNWKSIHPQALSITHPTKTYTEVIEEFKSYDNPRDVLQVLKAKFDNHRTPKSPEKFIFAGQNTSFDWRFMVAFWGKNKALTDCDMSEYFDTNITYDLMHLTRPLQKLGLLDVPNVKLGTIVEALDIKLTGNLHDALTDIEGTYKSFYQMIDIWKTHLTNINVSNKMSDGIKHFFKYSDTIIS